ncbi:MAG: spore germination protein GerW family protein [Candidatus Saccharicenans sp.]|nr:spore germination protein GerW family protein [Candidatus Saccharicenans sp.]
MKTQRFIILGLTLALVLGSLALAQTTTPLEQPLTTFDRLSSILKSGSVLGNPIQVGETIIIPFGKISFGLGGGGATMGYGGGMGGKTIPLGILIIENENVRVELFPEEEKKPSFLQEMLPVILKMLPELIGGKSTSAKMAPAPPGGEKGEPRPPASFQNASPDEMKKLFQEGRYSEANDMADFLLSKAPDNADLHAWKGNILGRMAQGNPLNMMKYGMAAMQEYEKALALDPENADAHFGRGMGRMMTPPQFGGSIDGAIEDFEAACKKKPSAEAYYYLGEAYKKKGLNDKAKVAYEKALKLRPNYPEAAKALSEIK